MAASTHWLASQTAMAVLEDDGNAWENAWDHAAGLLPAAEAGGSHATIAGESFRLADGNALPFTAARDEDTVRRIVGLLRASR